MKPLCVGIYGETCAGKSTLGKRLSLTMSCPYISFGDMKRQEIAMGSEMGLSIKKLLAQGFSLPAELSCAVIRSAIANGLNLISGYPISDDELKMFSAHVSMVGILTLKVDEPTLIQRFNLRRECPQCHLPGTINDICPNHHIQMVKREDVRLDELLARRKLYQQRIEPFLNSKLVEALPRLSLDSGVLTKSDIASQAEQWVRELIAGKQGEV